jgi:uncharacterized membrane protein
MSNPDISKEYYFSVPKRIKRGEEIVIFLRPHILSFFPEIALIVFFMLVPLILLAVLVFIFGGAETSSFLADRLYANIFILGSSAYYLAITFFALAEWINYYYDLLIVTRKHLINIDQKTIFNREINMLHLGQVEDVTSQIKGFFQSLFAFGNVIVQTAGATKNMLIKDISNPQKVAAKIIQLHSHNLKDSHPDRSYSLTQTDLSRFFRQGEKMERDGEKDDKR